jgi:hypothetical protein
MRICATVSVALLACWANASAETGGLTDRGYPTERIAQPKKETKANDVAKKKQPKKQSPPGKKTKTPRSIRGQPEVKAPPGKQGMTTELSRKQTAIRDAFLECASRSIGEDPLRSVLDFVFAEREDRELGGIRAYWSALRGSPEHHGHEVCLARSYGLRTFNTLMEIISEHGRSLSVLSIEYAYIPESDAGEDNVPAERRYARKWVVDYINELSRRYHASFGSFLRIGSAIRDAQGTQAALVLKGLTPADCNHDFLCSTHTSGSAIDISKKGLSSKQISWIEHRLIKDQKDRRIFFIIERSHFHVFVLPPEYIGDELSTSATR